MQISSFFITLAFRMPIFYFCMKYLYRKTSFITLLLFFVNTIIIKAIPGSLEFDRYTTNEGLSNGYINSIYQDKDGFIWMATGNGLNRFDGINFKSYYNNPKDSTTLPGTSITGIIEDLNGNIWVTTNINFCVYNREKDNFRRMKFFIDNQFLDCSITGCFIDSKGSMWISSYAGVFRFKLFKDPEKTNGIIKPVKYFLDGVDDFVSGFVEDENGIIWTVDSRNKLFYFDYKNGKFLSKEINHPEAENFGNHNKGIFKDSNNDIFITIEHVGLLWWNRKKDEFKLYKTAKGNRGPNGNILYAMCEDKFGNIWIGDRDSEGLSIFNKKTETFTFSQSDLMNPHSLSTNKITYLLKDRNNTIWVGTIMGMNKYSPDKIKFNRYYNIPNKQNWLTSNNILCFAESKNGDVWIGTDGGGLNKLNRKTGEITSYRLNKKSKNSISSDVIVSMIEDNEGVLWMGTFNGGLCKLKDGKFSKYINNPEDPNSISQDHVWAVFEDSKKNIWAGTLYGGLNLLDKKTNKFYRFRANNDSVTSISNNSIINIYETSDQKLFISTNNGTNVVDLKKTDFTKKPPVIKFSRMYHSDDPNSLSSNSVYGICEDNKGNIWFGHTTTGLDKYDVKNNTFKNYNTKNGLPGYSVNSMQRDNTGNLWLATDKGLVRFNTDTEDVTVYEKQDGLQNTSFKGWSLKTKDGEMFFGGPEGFNSFYPTEIDSKRNTNIPKVYITGMKIFNNLVKIDTPVNDRIVLTKDISQTEQIVLTHKEIQFSFEFIALDYHSPEKNKYAYKMEGFDADWVYIGNRREASYTNLDPGEYIFRVKASNNDGVWNEQGTSIKVKILPAWWETTIFKVSIVVLAALLSLFILQFRIKQINKQKRLLELQVAEKTSELQAKNKELKKAIATKDKFFSILAHDIKNPFNAILGFSNMLDDGFDEWDDNVKKEMISHINVSSKKLYELLENLLEWSRTQRGNIKYEPANFQIEDVVRNVVEIMQSTAKSKDISLFYTIDDHSLSVYADAHMVSTIIRNLLSNSLKFTNKGGQIKVGAFVKDDMATVEVTDNGVGMSEEALNKLFHLDTHFTSAGTDNEKGTGLGLILIKDFVLKNGGKYKIKSSPGNGTTFSFTLPLAK